MCINTILQTNMKNCGLKEKSIITNISVHKNKLIDDIKSLDDKTLTKRIRIIDKKTTTTKNSAEKPKASKLIEKESSGKMDT